MTSERPQGGLYRTGPTCLALLACLLLQLGCAPSPNRGPLTFRVDTLPSGRVIVVNHGGASWEPGHEWVAVEDLRIGRVEGGGPDQFGYVYALEVDNDGSVYVAEGLDQEIRRFAFSGEYVSTLGGRGSGPGEFMGLSGVRLDPTGRIWARDVHNMRYTVFSPEGKVLDSHPMRLHALLPYWEARVDSTGRLVDWDLSVPYRWEGTKTVWNDANSAGAALEYNPIAILPGSPRQDTLTAARQSVDYLDGGMARRPFSRTLVLHLDAGFRVWMAESTRYEIVSRTLSGDTTVAFTLPVVPEPVQVEEKLRVAREYFPGREIPLEQIPDVKPVVSSITSDSQGHVYVFPNTEETAAGSAMDVFLDSGVFLGTVHLPAMLDLRVAPVVKPPYLYGVTKDSMGVDYVVRFLLGPEQGDPRG